jgi:hypothetical protein
MAILLKRRQSMCEIDGGGATIVRAETAKDR